MDIDVLRKEIVKTHEQIPNTKELLNEKSFTLESLRAIVKSTNHETCVEQITKLKDELAFSRFQLAIYTDIELFQNLYKIQTDYYITQTILKKTEMEITAKDIIIATFISKIHLF